MSEELKKFAVNLSVGTFSGLTEVHLASDVAPIVSKRDRLRGKCEVLTEEVERLRRGENVMARELREWRCDTNPTGRCRGCPDCQTAGGTTDECRERNEANDLRAQLAEAREAAQEAMLSLGVLRYDSHLSCRGCGTPVDGECGERCHIASSFSRLAAVLKGERR